MWMSIEWGIKKVMNWQFMYADSCMRVLKMCFYFLSSKIYNVWEKNTNVYGEWENLGFLFNV